MQGFNGSVRAHFRRAFGVGVTCLVLPLFPIFSSAASADDNDRYKFSVDNFAVESLNGQKYIFSGWLCDLQNPGSKVTLTLRIGKDFEVMVVADQGASSEADAAADVAVSEECGGGDGRNRFHVEVDRSDIPRSPGGVWAALNVGDTSLVAEPLAGASGPQRSDADEGSLIQNVDNFFDKDLLTGEYRLNENGKIPIKGWICDREDPSRKVSLRLSVGDLPPSTFVADKAPVSAADAEEMLKVCRLPGSEPGDLAHRFEAEVDPALSVENPEVNGAGLSVEATGRRLTGVDFKVLEIPEPVDNSKFQKIIDDAEERNQESRDRLIANQEKTRQKVEEDRLQRKAAGDAADAIDSHVRREYPNNPTLRNINRGRLSSGLRPLDEWPYGSGR